MKHKLLPAICLLIPLCSLLSPNLGYAYKVGERLPKAAAPKAQQTPEPQASRYRKLEWEDLVPKGWDMLKVFDTLNYDQLQDNDPRATEALEKLRKAWEDAPVEPALNGQSIRISGFLIPLERNEGKISEFLLAPYFGACIHAPPPPPNQLIYVVAKEPFDEAEIRDDVWVNGTLYTEKMGSNMGKSSYLMQADAVTPYQEEKKAKIFLDMGGVVKSIPRTK